MDKVDSQVHKGMIPALMATFFSVPLLSRLPLWTGYPCYRRSPGPLAREEATKAVEGWEREELLGAMSYVAFLGRHQTDSAKKVTKF